MFNLNAHFGKVLSFLDEKDAHLFQQNHPIRPMTVTCFM